MNGSPRFCRECRSCGSSELHPIVSLGMTPIANTLVDAADAAGKDDIYPLGVALCTTCALVQLFYELPSEAIFTDQYPYFSSYSDTVVAHGQRHAEALLAEEGLGPDSLVVEVGSNDGYLLRPFSERGVPVLGIDPSPGPAAAARAAGVETLVASFGQDLAERLRAEGRRADVIIANNVMAHVPDLNGFVAGLATLVSDDGIVTIENPWVKDLVDQAQFDTIYHEHYSYFSTVAVQSLVERHGLHLVRVEHFPDLHGGTLRWTLSRTRAPEPSVEAFLATERTHGLDRLEYYLSFALRIAEIQVELMRLLLDIRDQGGRVGAYGAAAKGATLLNATRIPQGLVEFVCDKNPHKQGKLIPGVRLPIVEPARLLEERPAYCLLLAWNHAEEIMGQLEAYRQAGGRFIVPIPKPQIVG